MDDYKRPDLTPLLKASETVGRVLKPGDLVIYESTVYPGCTEEDCVPVLERHSGLTYLRVDRRTAEPGERPQPRAPRRPAPRSGQPGQSPSQRQRCPLPRQRDRRHGPQPPEPPGFYCGYSPERINPGDPTHRLTTIKKVTSGSTPEVAAAVDALYRQIITAGTHPASSIRVAEAAKVIENTQRDLNIALMNELALIFGRLGIDTLEVLEAAGSKWNFLPFRPGLVGGHCIGVDPYYLTHKAVAVGYHPEVILAGRRINDRMGAHVAEDRGQAHAAPRHRGLPQPHPGARPRLQGELPGPAQHPRDRHHPRPARLQHRGRLLRPLDRPRRGASTNTASTASPSCPAPGTYDAVILAVAHRDFVELGAAGLRRLGQAPVGPLRRQVGPAAGCRRCAALGQARQSRRG